jgi:predicted enzyme related to lactoylglutathione lyase
MLNKLVHFEIGCRDRAEQGKFYGSLFDWKLEETPIMTSLRTGDAVGGHLNQLGHEPHNYVTFYIEVEDVAESAKKAVELGGKLVAGPLEYTPGNIFAWITDPEGNMIGLHHAGNPS